MYVDPIPILRNVLIQAGYQAGVSTPEEYTSTPFVQIGQVDGSILEEGYGEHTVIALTILAKGYGNARRTALEVRQVIVDLQDTIHGGFLFDLSHPVTGPICVENATP